MCYFLLGFLNSGYEAVENCQPFRILERAVLSVAGFTWGARTERGDRDCECGELDYHLGQIVPSSSFDRGLEEQIIVREPVVDAGIQEMFGTVTHAKLEELTTTPYLPYDDQSAHLANDELADQGIDYRTKYCSRYNRDSRDEIENDEVYVLDEEKDNMMFTPKKTTALCSKYLENFHKSDLFADNCNEECKLQEQKWDRPEFEEEVKARWDVDPMNSTTQSSSSSDAEADPIYNTNAPVMSLMNDLADFKSVLVTLATHFDDAGEVSPSLEEQIERALSEEFHREESSNLSKQQEQQQDYHKTLKSISSEMVVIRTSLDGLQDVLKYYNTNG